MPNKPKQSKPKKCKVCTGLFSPYKSTDQTCSPICAIAWKESKEMKAAKKAFNQVTRKMREAIKTKAQWAKEAQAEFNKYIRVRDEKLPCISCGKPNDGSHQRHASHYRSRGAHPELAFDETNVHASCMQCNSIKSGNIVDYRLGLLLKVGTKAVEVLEGPHEPKKYTIDDYKAIKAKYKMKAKDLLTRIREAGL